MRNIPIDMLDDFAQDATTFCRLIKVITKDGTVLGFTTLDAALTFDDGVHEVEYSPLNGMTPSRVETTADFSVDNAEFLGWVAASGITEHQIRAGLFNHAKIIVYKVNYLNLTPGRCVIEQAGRCGETTFTNSSFKIEFRSKTQQIKQPVGDLTSLTCRTQFGSPQCGKEFVWTEGEVTSVDTEVPDQLFSGDVTTEPTGGYELGIVEMLTGNNAGIQMEVEVFSAGAIELQFPMPYDIEVGDTYRIRQDCGKTKNEWCRDVHNNVLRFRGEPFTPVADGTAAQIPGAQVSG